MRLHISRASRRSPTGEPVLLEVVTPRTNAATVSAAEHLLAGLAGGDGYALEISADAQRRRFLVRCANAALRDQVVSQIAAAYPQAELRSVAATDDPLRIKPAEEARACELTLRAPPYLPIRTLTDLDLDGVRAVQADPLLGVVNAPGEVPPGWRVTSQLVLRPAAVDWARGFQRHAVQHPLAHERFAGPAQQDQQLVGLLWVLLVVGLTTLQGVLWARRGDWLPALALLSVVLAGTAFGALRLRRWLSRPAFDTELVRARVLRIAFRARLRLVAVAPAGTDRAAVDAHLARLAAAYGRYALAGANSFVAGSPHPARSEPVSVGRRAAMLTTLEVAGLWHLPHAAADVPLLERTSARTWLPLPATVEHGCRVGVSVQQGQHIPVALPDSMLQRHLLLVAKTRRGKSTLLLRLAEHLLATAPERAIMLVDPHRDLATALLERVPAARANEVVWLDVADTTRPFGLNLLDVGLGWSRDRAVANTLAVFQREWGDRFWGPRMEDAFRFALLTLLEANAALCAADPAHGRVRQHTLLEVPRLFAEPAFRQEVLRLGSDPGVQAWWRRYYDPLDRRLQQEIVNPILSKVHRFEGSRAARQIVGQPASTIDPRRWLEDRQVVVVNTARGEVGDNIAALVGSTLLNLMTFEVAAQAALDVSQRAPVTLFVDEFHTIPGADYEGMLAELNKFGANLVLATQSLSRLTPPAGSGERDLRAMVFANLDGLFAFNCSAEDADYLVPELGGMLDVQDLVELGEHQCYVRLSAKGRRQPTFSVRLDPPSVGDPARGAAIAHASALRYGQPADELNILLRARAAPPPAPVAHAIESATPVEASVPVRARNAHRPRKKRAQRAEARAELVDVGG